MGHVVNRSEFDGAGKHYPVLSMELDRERNASTWFIKGRKNPL